LDAIAKAKAKLIVIAVLLISLGQDVARPCARAQDLHAQSASALLARDFGDPDLSYLLLDEDGRIVAQRWDGPEREIPVGSLTKPFMAVAYGRTHRSFPKFRCTGKKTCWLPRGHGVLWVREAIAFSCNSYFHQLVAGAGRGFGPAMESFDLHAPASADGPRSLATASPLALARAYLELTRHAQEREVRPVLQGMALSARSGTAKAVATELPALTAMAKTGTAACTHKKKAPGDGFALVMAPADHPRTVLLVRLHGRPGFIAAGVAGRMIAEVESSGAPRK
jgi:cell division protein FtsI/penicillin-binding protein 2